MNIKRVIIITLGAFVCGILFTRLIQSFESKLDGLQKQPPYTYYGLDNYDSQDFVNGVSMFYDYDPTSIATKNKGDILDKNVGLIKSPKIADKVGLAILSSKYGADSITVQKPLSTYLLDGKVWKIIGKQRGVKDLRSAIYIQKVDGKILRIKKNEAEGNVQNIKHFHHSKDGFLMEDSTVIMFGEDLVSTPAVAYEIANVLLRSSFDSDLFKNTIWGISQNKEAWEVTNSPDQSDGSIVFGGIIQIFINKKNGMVYDINALK